ncbi:MAG: putative lipopolysaccharide heptosyltransferase III [Nitrospirae bacterium]|nr:putative lipopolysaccharide heptosyltransferase III [Nitrospirota bacterium]
MSTINLREIQSILVIKLRHIGDVLLTTPTFRALKTAIPHARTVALVPKGTEDMLTLNPCVDEVITFEKGAGLVHELGLVRRLRAEKPDLVINMTEGDRGAIMGLLSGARYRIGVDPEGRGFLGKRLVYTHTVPTVYDGRHKAVMDMDLLGPLGIAPVTTGAELYTSQEDDEYVAGILERNGVPRDAKTAVVHPTSRWLFKCWRDEAVAAVIDHIEGRGIRAVITSGPDAQELDRVRNILSLVRSRPVDLSGKLTLKRLASVCRRAEFFFGVDTAPMHMAAAVGTPVVALFGPSDSVLWGPLTGRRVVVEKLAEFPCIPCHRDGCEGSKRSRCLEAITVEDAVEAVEIYIRCAVTPTPLP